MKRNFNGKLSCFAKNNNFIKKRPQQRYFPVKFAKFLKVPILKNICELLLLLLVKMQAKSWQLSLKKENFL